MLTQMFQYSCRHARQKQSVAGVIQVHLQWERVASILNPSGLATTIMDPGERDARGSLGCLMEHSRQTMESWRAVRHT